MQLAPGRLLTAFRHLFSPGFGAVPERRDNRPSYPHNQTHTPRTVAHTHKLAAMLSNKFALILLALAATSSTVSAAAVDVGSNPVTNLDTRGWTKPDNEDKRAILSTKRQDGEDDDGGEDGDDDFERRQYGHGHHDDDYYPTTTMMMMTITITTTITTMTTTTTTSASWEVAMEAAATVTAAMGSRGLRWLRLGPGLVDAQSPNVLAHLTPPLVFSPCIRKVLLQHSSP
ncbi:hypothetical protein V8E36_003081 [Tilletia maclaganii]